MKNFKKSFFYFGAILILLILTLSGCCKLFPKMCEDSPKQPVWSNTYNGTGYNGKVTDIIRIDSLFIAVGYTGSGAVWTSPDGYTWNRISLDNTVFPNNSKISNIYFYSSLFATGKDNFGQTIVWRANRKGDEWRLITPVFYDQDGNTVANGLVYIKDIIELPPSIIQPPAPSGDFVDIAVGAIYDPIKEVYQATIWKKVPDYSETWQEVFREPTEEATYVVGGSTINCIIETSPEIIQNSGPALIAVGSCDSLKGTPVKVDEDVAIWTSNDGITWKRLKTDSRVFALDELEKDQGLNTAMITGKAIYVGGYEAGQTSSSGPIWKSLDYGASWVRLTDADSANFSAFNDKHTIYSLISKNLPFGYGEIAVGFEKTDNVNNPPGKIGAFWRGATGFPRWRGGANSIFDQAELLQVSSDGNVIVAVGYTYIHTPVIWTLGISNEQ